MKAMKNTKTYSEMLSYDNFDDRFEYLKLNGNVAEDTFGYNRFINQQFYKSKEWKRVRDQVIVRDNGCDLGIQDKPINGKIYIHHMNPLVLDDISFSTDNLLDPEYLVCVSMNTHNALHYGNINNVKSNIIIERQPNDTCPWKNN